MCIFLRNYIVDSQTSDFTQTKLW